ncbi:insoluble matrix shell protein 3-like [Mercenaria mercenaria]|uniref:insoluble matrix shell protein 3-like n=1 Tax=Mercenaria mercenaria TaxID=6596 RepID=UPI00234FA637|nr:insoluble matrix shell protein 3-like [Mercenaria mercenaria]
MLVLLCLIATVLPWTVVEGMRSCWADSRGPGEVCRFGTVVKGGGEMEISYNFTFPFSQICCQALSCTNTKCSFMRVGCHTNGNIVPIQTAPLPWEVPNIEPMMRCYEPPGMGTVFRFSAALVPES